MTRICRWGIGLALAGLMLASGWSAEGAEKFRIGIHRALFGSFEVVADRMERWAKSAGRENVMFGNDCGFQSTAGNEEIPISIAWAKLAALGEGAKIASRRLWS